MGHAPLAFEPLNDCCSPLESCLPIFVPSFVITECLQIYLGDVKALHRRDKFAGDQRR